MITKEKFIPRNRDTMIWLWGIYLTLNLVETLLLCGGGMSLFDSLCHSFGTVSTSGYSPKNASIGHYDSAYFDWVIIVFMFLGGMTFMLFYHMVKGNLESHPDQHRISLVCGGSGLLFCSVVTLILWRAGTYDSFVDALRYATFQIMSLVTDTGFTTADYEGWPQGRPDVSLRILFYRRLRRIHHQRHQGGPLCHHLEIHGGLHQKNLFSTHWRWSLSG